MQSLKNLKSQSIYFGAPSNFNDPYDCALRVSIAEPQDEHIERVRNHYLAQPDVPDQARRELEEMRSETLKELTTRSARNLVESSIQDFLKQNGVSCFSEVNDDLLMWSHYGDKYKGFCLEFATDYEPFNKLRKVKYVEEMPKIDPLAAILKDNYDEYLDLFCTKSSNWSYEREWRAMHKVAETVFIYPAEALRGVYFGPDMDQETLEIICLVLMGQNRNVQFWKGSRNSDCFKVEFEHFMYMSHLEAKDRGLVT